MSRNILPLVVLYAHVWLSNESLTITFCFEGKFEYGVAEGIVDPSLNPISAFRLSVIHNSAVWAILNEVRIYAVYEAT